VGLGFDQVVSQVFEYIKRREKHAV
jgi:hypothetical protein